MKWKLKVFDPGRKKKGVKDILQWWINTNLKNISTDIVRIACKRCNKKKTVSLFAGPIESQKAKPEFVLLNVKKLQEISRGLKLNPVEEAVLFGSAAGFYEHEIGERIGCAESRVSQIKKQLFGRVKRWLKE